jgi:hypothetical protein
MKTKLFLMLFVFSGLLTGFTSCKPDEVENPNNILAENMITAKGVADIQVVLDNKAKTIDISIPFEAKDSISKLTLLFNDLPAGAMVSPLSEVKDFSNNLRHNYTVTFQDGAVKIYSVGVTFAGLQPKLTKLTLNGVQVKLESGVWIAQLLASEDLKVVKLAYQTNEPTVTVKIKNTDNDDYVALDTTAVNNKYNFEDKLNGRKFKLEYNGVSNIITVKVVTSGYTKITKVWQTFAGFGTLDFYGIKALAGTSPATTIPKEDENDEWDRNIAMDDNYIYIARANKNMGAEPAFYPAYGVIAIKISDKSAKLLDRTGMYTTGETGLGAHGTTDVNVIGGKIVACNLANAANNVLKVFVWDNVDAAPRVLFTYNVGATPSPRLGDKFTFEGDLTNGKLRFVDFNANNRYYEFTITAGVVNTTPTIVTVPGVFEPSTGNTFGGIYKYSPTEYMFSGSGKQAVVFNPVTMATTYKTPGSVFPSSQIGDAFFTFNDKNYLAYLYATDSWKRWVVTIRPLDYPTLAESLEKISTKATYINISGPGYTDTSSFTNANATGKIYYHKTTSGDVYLVAVASNQGITLLKVE